MKNNINIEFTTITNFGGLLTKTICPDGDGGILKKPAAHMITGMAETVKMPFTEFGPFLRTLESNQAITHGITGSLRELTVVTAEAYLREPDTVARTKEFFYYPEGTGLGMFDHDPKPGKRVLEVDEFLHIVHSVCPDFKSVPTWWTPSTSSCINDLTGNQLTGAENGWHLYFPFSPANKLPEFSEWLFKKLWIAGHGHIYISRAGSLLTRTIFDAAVFSPERLDFVAGAYCIDCEQQLPEPVFRDALEVLT